MKIITMQRIVKLTLCEEITCKQFTKGLYLNLCCLGKKNTMEKRSMKYEENNNEIRGNSQGTKSYATNCRKTVCNTIYGIGKEYRCLIIMGRW